MSKELIYMNLIKRHRKDGLFTLIELTQWIQDEEGITYSGARGKVSRLIKRLPVEALSKTMFRLTVIPEDLPTPIKSKKKDEQQVVTKPNELELSRTIIAYLNQQAGTTYRGSVAHISKIKARLSEGFTEMEFRIVIDKKTKEWKGTEYEKYLRPETLFSGRFESYLNQKETPGGKMGAMANFDFEKYKG